MKTPAFISRFFEWFRGALSFAERLALDAAKNLNISDDMQKAAVAAVMAAEASGGTGEQKFQAATAAVLVVFGKDALGAIRTAVQNAWAVKFGKPNAEKPN